MALGSWFDLLGSHISLEQFASPGARLTPKYQKSQKSQPFSILAEIFWGLGGLGPEGRGRVGITEITEITAHSALSWRISQGGLYPARVKGSEEMAM